MPTNTFFNLPIEKKEKIINAAKSEFVEYSFHDASINRIIKSAGISRGSFYMYFENKEDLFVYILKGCRQRVIREVFKELDGKKCDIFEFHLLLFDVMASDRVSGVDKDILVTTVSNMNFKLMNEIGDFVWKEDINMSSYEDELSQILESDNIRLNSMEDIEDLNHMLTHVIMFVLGEFFSNKMDREQSRKKLINQFKLIKYGVIKNI